MKTETNLKFIENVRKLRTEKGITQESLGDMLDVSAAFIGMVESPNYPHKYNVEHLVKLC